MLSGGADADATDRSLELDQGMGPVVLVGRASFAVGAEVGVIAHGALVTVTHDVGDEGALGSRGAQRTVAADAVVDGSADVAGLHVGGILQVLVDGHEAVVGVDESRIGDAVGAVVPVRAVQALVADANDSVIAAIADGAVLFGTSGSQPPGDGDVDLRAFHNGGETVLGVVAVLVLGEAVLAEVKVLASGAVHELDFGKF